MSKSQVQKNLYWIGAALILLVVVPIIWLVFAGTSQDLSRFLDQEYLRFYIQSFGIWAPIVYVFFQSLQVVIAPFPGELTGSIAGALFGGWMGSLYATFGLALGGLIAFSLGRILGKPLLVKLFGDEAFEKYAFVRNERRNMVILVTFLIPGFPKDILTYIFSFGKVRFSTFFVLSQLGRLPGTLVLTFFGAAAIERDWKLVGILAFLTFLMVIGAYLFRGKIEAILSKY